MGLSKSTTIAREGARLGIIIGEYFYLHRKHLNKTIAQMAIRADISLATLQRIEQGDGNPSLGLVMSLCNVYGIKMSRLMLFVELVESVGLDAAFKTESYLNYHRLMRPIKRPVKND